MTRRIGLSLLLAVILVVLALSAASAADPTSLGEQQSLVQVWQTPMPSSSFGGASRPRSIVTDQRQVYLLLGPYGKLHLAAFRLPDGKTAFEQNIEGAEALFPSSNGFYMDINLEIQRYSPDGKPLWATQGRKVWETPEGSLIDANGQLKMLDTATGRELWSVEGVIPIIADPRDMAELAAEGTGLGWKEPDVLIGFDLKTGRVLWQIPNARIDPLAVPYPYFMTITPELIILHTFRSAEAIDRRTHEILWKKTDLYSSGRAVNYHGHVYRFAGRDFCEWDLSTGDLKKIVGALSAGQAEVWQDRLLLDGGSLWQYSSDGSAFPLRGLDPEGDGSRFVPVGDKMLQVMDNRVIAYQLETVSAPPQIPNVKWKILQQFKDGGQLLGGGNGIGQVAAHDGHVIFTSRSRAQYWNTTLGGIGEEVMLLDLKSSQPVVLSPFPAYVDAIATNAAWAAWLADGQLWYRKLPGDSAIQRVSEVDPGSLLLADNFALVFSNWTLKRFDLTTGVSRTLDVWGATGDKRLAAFASDGTQAVWVVQTGKLGSGSWSMWRLGHGGAVNQVYEQAGSFPAARLIVAGDRVYYTNHNHREQRRNGHILDTEIYAVDMTKGTAEEIFYQPKADLFILGANNENVWLLNAIQTDDALTDITSYPVLYLLDLASGQLRSITESDSETWLYDFDGAISGDLAVGVDRSYSDSSRDQIVLLDLYGKIKASGGTPLTIVMTLGEKSATVNGTSTAIPAAPMLSNGTTMVPLRFLADAFGAKVSWNNGQIGYEEENTSIQLWLGRTQATVNGHPWDLSEPPQIMDGVTMVPLRFVSECLSAKVTWDTRAHQITITRG